MTAQQIGRPSLVPVTVQFVPMDGPGITPQDWEARAKHLADLLTEDEFPPDELPNSLRELSLRDEAGWSWTYDGSSWWVWDGAAWIQRVPTGQLQLMPFTMETHVDAVPSPIPAVATSARPYAPTHHVPAAGMSAWPRPDPALRPEHHLAAGLDVMVIEQRDDGWAHVVFSNDWEAWVDGRRLVPVTP